MTGALIILAVTVIVGFVLWLIDRRRHGEEKPEVESAATQPAPDGECCGLHAVCEKGARMAFADDPSTLYFDDEELDRFAGRPADSYDDAETDEFRDVMLTLRPSEAAEWDAALYTRGIALPTELRDELMLIIADNAPQHQKP